MSGNLISVNLYGVHFRQARDIDKLKIYKWRNSDRVRLIMRNSDLISMKDHLEWFSSLDREKEIVLIFGYEKKDIGVISIKFIDKLNYEGNLGVYVGDANFLGSPYNILAILIAYNYCFRDLKIFKIRTSVHKLNDSALRLNKILGFCMSKNIDKSFDEYTLNKEKFDESYKKLIKLYHR
jgi:RimJ/RimL family protein N-acetyltransferase